MKVQEVELQVQYSEDINIYHTVHSIFALPVANVQGGFDNIRANAVANDKLDLLFSEAEKFDTPKTDGRGQVIARNTAERCKRPPKTV